MPWGETLPPKGSPGSHDWRKQFGREDLAFHIVSLANYEAAADRPRDDAWSELREAQAMTAKTVPGDHGSP